MTVGPMQHYVVALRERAVYFEWRRRQPPIFVLVSQCGPNPAAGLPRSLLLNNIDEEA